MTADTRAALRRLISEAQKEILEIDRRHERELQQPRPATERQPRSQRTHCRNGHTDWRIDPDGYRTCRTCERERKRRRKERNPRPETSPQPCPGCGRPVVGRSQRARYCAQQCRQRAKNRRFNQRHNSPKGG